VLSSPESALLLSDIYDNEFNLTEQGNPIDDMLGPVLYRRAEDVSEYTSYDSLIDIYLKFDIQKFFGLTLIEFTDLTKSRIKLLVNKAEVEIIKINEAMAEVSDEISNTNKTEEY